MLCNWKAVHRNGMRHTKSRSCSRSLRICRPGIHIHMGFVIGRAVISKINHAGVSGTYRSFLYKSLLARKNVIVQVGYMIAGMRTKSEAHVGDTIINAEILKESSKAFRSFIDAYGSLENAIVQGFREIRPMVFAGLYPQDSSQYDNLRAAIEKV